MMLSVSFYWTVTSVILWQKNNCNEIKFKIANLRIKLKISPVKVSGLTITLEQVLDYKGNYIY
jgi:hypothetical protein